MMPPSTAAGPISNGTVLGQIWARYKLKFSVPANQLSLANAPQVWGFSSSSLFQPFLNLTPKSFTTVVASVSGLSITFTSLPPGFFRFVWSSVTSLALTGSGNFSVGSVVGAISGGLISTTFLYAVPVGTIFPYITCSFTNSKTQNVTVNLTNTSIGSALTASGEILLIQTSSLNKSKVEEMSDQIKLLTEQVKKLEMRPRTPALSHVMEQY